MKLKVLGSSSRGNCYLLENNTEILIIEAGVNFDEVKKALNFKLNKVKGVIITHEHNDHAKYVKKYLDSGISVFCSKQVIESKELKSSFVTEVEPNKKYKVGNFIIMPFSVIHDVPCFAYIIEHADFGRLLFITDTEKCNYKINGLNHIMIECNYSLEIVSHNENRSRYTSHVELSECKRFLLRNDLSKVHNVILLHLSDDNSDEALFVDEIKKTTGKPIYAAKKGLELCLQ